MVHLCEGVQCLVAYGFTRYKEGKGKEKLVRVRKLRFQDSGISPESCMKNGSDVSIAELTWG